MKIFVKTQKCSRFEIQVNLEDTIADVKKNIENVQGHDVYPAARQMIIKQGQILKDDTTLEQNKISENSYIIMLLKAIPPPPPPPVAPPPHEHEEEVISLSHAEVDAIYRLIEMGFEEQMAIDAFLVCDNNEQLAANHLLDHMDWFLR